MTRQKLLNSPCFAACWKIYNEIYILVGHTCGSCLYCLGTYVVFLANHVGDTAWQVATVVFIFWIGQISMVVERLIEAK